MTHGKPRVTMHEKENACRTHSKPCFHMHGTWNVYKMGWRSVHRGGEEQKRKEGKRKEKGRIGREKKRKREGEKKGREREKRKLVFRKSKLVGLRSKVHIFDEDYAPRGRDSSYFGLFATINVVGLCLLSGMVP